MKTITLAIGLMVLIALSPQAMAIEGEPDQMIKIDTEELDIEFVNLDGEAFTIDFIRGQGEGSNVETLEGTIVLETNGYGYHVIIGTSEEEPVNGEYIDLPTGTYTIVATAGGLTATATVYVP